MSVPTRTRTRVLEEYFQTCQLDEIFTNILDELLRLQYPPDNPFPFILRRLRLHEPEQSLFVVPAVTVKQHVATAVSSADPHTPVAHGRNNFDAWGLQSNLQVCSLEAMTQFKAMLGERAPTFEVREGDYDISVMSAICDTAMTFKSVGSHERLDWMDIRQEYIVRGPQLEKALNAFAVQMMQDVWKLQNDSDSDVIEGVFIAKANHQTMWPIQDIQTKKKAFIAELKSAMLDRATVYLKGEFFMSYSDEYGNTRSEFVTLKKRYSFLFKNLEGQASNHAPFDYDTMLQGLFFHKHAAEEYYDHHRALDLTAAQNQMAASLRAQLVSSSAQGDQWRVLELVLQLAVVEHRTDGILTRLYRIFNSTVGATHSLMQQINSMKTIVQVSLQHQMWNQLNLCKERFLKFKERMLELLFTNEASEFIEMRLGARALLEMLTDKETYGKLVVDDHTIERLEMLHDLCSLALESMIQNIVRWFPQIQERINLYLSESGHVAAISYTPKKKLRCIDLKTEEARLLGEGRVPKAVHREAAMLQYLVDSKVDLWMEDMLVDIFLNFLPPNPFPTIVHHLRQLSYRYLLRAKPDGETLDLCSASTLLVSDNLDVYNVDSYFGSYVATAHVDTARLDSYTDLLRDVSNSRQAVQGAVEIRVITAVRSNGCLLHAEPVTFERPTLELYEDYFVTALELQQGLDVYVDSVLSHATKLHDSPVPHLVIRVSVNDTQHTMAEVKGQRSQIMAQFKTAVRAKAYITIDFCMLQGPRYIYVTKHAVLQFKDAHGGRGRFLRMGPTFGTAQHELLYTSQADAEFVVTHTSTNQDPQLLDLEACQLLHRVYDQHVAMGKWLEASEVALLYADTLQKMQQHTYDATLSETPPNSVPDCLRVLGSALAVTTHLFQECEGLLHLVTDATDIRSKINDTVLRGMIQNFCDHLLEFVFDDDSCCLEGIKELADGRTKVLLQAAQTNVFVQEVEAALAQLRNYLAGLLSSTGIVIHKSVHSCRADIAELANDNN